MLSRVLIFLLRAYQWMISPFLGSNCRFYPTCSQYAVEAIQVHGAIRGTGLIIKRLSKCHPYHEGGFDPVPTERARSPHLTEKL